MLLMPLLLLTHRQLLLRLQMLLLLFLRLLLVLCWAQLQLGQVRPACPSVGQTRQGQKGSRGEKDRGRKGGCKDGKGARSGLWPWVLERRQGDFGASGAAGFRQHEREMERVRENELGGARGSLTGQQQDELELACLEFHPTAMGSQMMEKEIDGDHAGGFLCLLPWALTEK